jgi:ATP-dependent helicase Lhr and Lhr-like helicase
MIAPAALKERLPHTWPVFFARYGNFTPVQVAAIPPILDGRNTLVMAATAAGKTEAALAPLLERHLHWVSAHGSEPALRLLYIAPTRALVRDLYERLAPALAALNITLVMKSGDTGPVSATNPPTVLITTPESTDSLLTRTPRLFTKMRAVVIDEIHLFDNTPRGDHLRCLLRRGETIQHYHSQQTDQVIAPFQRVALSATLPDPDGVAARYLAPTEETGSQPALVEITGSRPLAAVIRPLYGLDDLVAALTERATGEAGIRKSLIFCNTRNEVEQVAAYLRQQLPFAAAVFVHYSNLDPALRRQVEDDFALAPVALCVCTSTLELGIDIGSIDEVVLIGPPPTVSAFLQRIGRGSRRRAVTQVLCLARSPLELLHFQALVDLARQDAGATRHLRAFAPTYHFRPSVLVQQAFSILKQSPTGALRLADLKRVTPEATPDEEVRLLLANLVAGRYLQAGRPGEWRPGPVLDELLDAHEIYSNIGGDPLKATLVDAFSGRTIAQTGRIHLEGETLLMGGRVLKVVWRDRYRIGVQPDRPGPADEELRFQTAPFAVPLEIGQMMAAHLHLAPGQIAFVHDRAGGWLFHFWGEIYGALLAALLQTHLAGRDEDALVQQQNAHCLRLPVPLAALPPWPGAEVQRQVRIMAPRLAAALELGRFHSFLPPALADRTILALCDLPRFEQLFRTAKLVTPAAGLRTRLLDLV